VRTRNSTALLGIPAIGPNPLRIRIFEKLGAIEFSFPEHISRDRKSSSADGHEVAPAFEPRGKSSEAKQYQIEGAYH
jgi:hypothetical protein